jgi:Omp85 superfamily domain
MNPIILLTLSVLSVLWQLLPVRMNAQGILNTQTDTIQQDSLLTKPESNFYFISPSGTLSPETGIAGGLYGMYYFKLSKKVPDTRSSFSDFTMLYTQRHQFSFLPTWKIYFIHEHYTLSGEGNVMLYRENFFGIGNNTIEANEEMYEFHLLKMDNKFQRQLYSVLFAGLQYQIQYMSKIEIEHGGQLETQNITGNRGGLASGIGPMITIDSRSSVLTPQSGMFIELSNCNFREWLGSKFGFTTYVLDARKYITLYGKKLVPDMLNPLGPLYKRHILALQLYGRITQGDAPFRMLSLMGNSQLMRGYYMGRYRDNDYVAGQAELRMHLFWRMGATLFAGTGEVAHTTNDFSIKELKPNYGMGLRYVFSKRENVNVRLDAGFGPHTKGFYITMGEAF